VAAALAGTAVVALVAAAAWYARCRTKRADINHGPRSSSGEERELVSRRSGVDNGSAPRCGPAAQRGDDDAWQEWPAIVHATASAPVRGGVREILPPALAGARPSAPERLGVRVSTKRLEYALGGGMAPVDAVLNDTFVVTNTGSSAARISFGGQAEREDRFSVSFREARARRKQPTSSDEEEGAACGTAIKIRAGKSAEVRSSWQQMCTAAVSVGVPMFVARGNGAGFDYAVFALLEVDLAGRPSAKLDWRELGMTRVAGAGAFGTVYQGTYRGQTVAVKVFKNQVASEDALDRLKAEASILVDLRSPYVVAFLGACFAPGHLCIVSEYLRRGSLGSLLDTERRGELPGPPPSTELRLKIAVDCARGMTFLHASRIVHRDLKPDNVLMVDAENPTAEVNCKLCDFGTARECAPGSGSRQTKGVGTPMFMAPELLTGRDAMNASEKSDVYSYAVLLYELFSGQAPYADESAFPTTFVALEFINRGQRLDVSHVEPNEVSRIIAGCWAHSPELRPAFSDVCSRLQPLLGNAMV
jgi:hypothetical protein